MPVEKEDAPLEGIEVNVEIQDIKGVDDILAVYGNDFVQLTPAEVKALFDEDLTTSYPLRPNEGLFIALKIPHDIHHVKFLSTGGWCFEGDDFYALMFGVSWFDIWQYDGAGVMDVKNQVQYIEFYNDSAAIINVGGVIIKQYSQTQVHAPVDQPLNVNPRLEVVWQDIARIEEWYVGEPEPEFIRVLRYDEVRMLFDKIAYGGGAIALPPDCEWRVIFYKPLQIHTVEADGSDGYEVTLNWSVVFATGWGLGIFPNATIDQKLAEVDLRNPSSEVGVTIAELVFKTFIHADVSVDVSVNGAVDVKPIDIKLWNDILRVTDDAHELTPTELQSLFSPGYASPYTLIDRHTLTIYFKRPHDVHHAKFVNDIGQILKDPDITITYTDSDGVSYEETGTSYAEIKNEIYKIAINNSTGGDIIFTMPIIKQFTDVRAHAPYKQPLLNTSQDYATPQDFDIGRSRDDSTVTSEVIRELLDQDLELVAIPESLQGERTIILYPKTAGMEVVSVAVIGEDKGVFTLGDAVLSVQGTHQGEIQTTHDTLWLPEVKYPVNRVIVTFPAGVAFNLIGIQIKKYQFMEVHSQAQQPTKVQEDQELTLQDILSISVGHWAEPETYLWQDFVIDADLPDSVMKLLFDKKVSGFNYISLLAGTALFIRLKSAKYVDEVEFLRIDPFNVPGSEASFIYYTPETAVQPHGPTATPSGKHQVKDKVHTIVLVNTQAEGSINISEVIARTFKTVEVNGTVAYRDYKIPEDFAHIKLLPEDTELPASDVAKMFDGDQSTYYVLAPSHTLLFDLKMPHDIHHIKIMDLGNVIVNPYLHVFAYPSAPYKEADITGIGLIEPKGNVMRFYVENLDPVNPINIYGVIVKQMAMAQVNSPKYQPQNVTEQDYAVPDDFDLKESQSQSTVGILSSHIMEWLDQDREGPIFATPWETDPTIVLIPKNGSMEAKDILIADGEGGDVRPYACTNAILKVYPIIGEPITVYQRLWIPEIKVPIWKIEITLDHDYMSTVTPFAILIKKYVFRQVHAESQQPVKVEEDQEITLQDVARMNLGYISEGEWEDDAELDMQKMKLILDKRTDTGYVNIPHGGALRIYLKTPRFVDEVEGLGITGGDIHLADGIKFWWVYADGDGVLVEGPVLTDARQVIKDKVISIIIENLHTETDIAIYEFLARLFKETRFFGQEWTPNPEVPGFVEVADADTAVLAANRNRKYACFVNDSDNVMYLGIGVAAVVGSGIRLNPKGGSFEINWMNMTKVAINAIATVAGSNLTVVEGE